MASQISYCYAANRQARIPVRHVIHTSASNASSPRLWPPLEKAPCERWIGSHWFGGHLEDYLKAFYAGPTEEAKPEEDAAAVCPGGISAATHSLVYLSADAEEELETLRDDEVYIIGGIVDRNRYKVSRSSFPPRDTQLQ
jgi:tRNA (guanine9-N1)-methyltransferase